MVCEQCNRLKSDKWIGKDSEVSNNRKERLEDPASEEYNKNLYREEKGKTMYNSEVGKYM